MSVEAPPLFESRGKMIEGTNPSSLPGSSKPQDEANTSESVASILFPQILTKSPLPWRGFVRSLPIWGPKILRVIEKKEFF